MAQRATRFLNQVIAHQSERPIVADIYLCEGVAPLVIIAHGFKSFKNWGAYDQVADYLVEKGFHVLKFNFSHNGGTADRVIDFPDLEAFGENTYALEQSDLSLVMDYVHSSEGLEGRFLKSQVALIGHSRGGAMATLFAASDNRVKALVTWNAVGDLLTRLESYDLEELRQDGVIFISNGRTKQEMPIYVSFLDDIESDPSRYDLSLQAKEVACPSLIIHCEDDETVSVDDAHILSDAIPSSRLYPIASGGHTFGVRHPWTEVALPAAMQEACERSVAFLEDDLGW